MRFAFKTSPQSTTWDDMLAVWQAADGIELFESGWTFDHFEPIFSDRSGPCLEGWLTLTALAQATSRLRVGVLVTGVSLLAATAGAEAVPSYLGGQGGGDASAIRVTTEAPSTTTTTAAAPGTQLAAAIGNDIANAQTRSAIGPGARTDIGISACPEPRRDEINAAREVTPIRQRQRTGERVRARGNDVRAGDDQCRACFEDALPAGRRAGLDDHQHAGCG